MIHLNEKGKTILTAALCAVLGLGAIGGVGYLAHDHVGNAVVAKATAVAETSDKYVSDYDDELDYYDMLQARHEEEQKAQRAQSGGHGIDGLVLPADMQPVDQVVDDEYVQQLRDEGIDPARVVCDESGVWVYLIQPGDTLSHLSAVFGYSVDELANFNQIRNVNLIYANSSLRIPGGDEQ